MCFVFTKQLCNFLMHSSYNNSNNKIWKSLVGEQNLPPQYVSLAYRFFQAEKNQGPKDSGRNFDLSPSCLKECRQRTVPGRELSPEITIVMNQVCRQGGTQQSLFVKIPFCVPLSLPGPANICLSIICFSIPF